MDLESLPEWVRYVAQDANGFWWGYKHEPIMSGGEYRGVNGKILREWIVDPFSVYDPPQSYPIEHGPAPDDWTQELYEIVRE